MHLNTQRYFKSALSLRLPVEKLESIGAFCIKLGKHRYFFHGFDHPFNNFSSSLMCSNKYFTHHLLAQAGIPVPKSRVLTKAHYEQGQLPALIAHLRYPLVVKPLANYGLGIDVRCNIKTEAHLTAYIEQVLPIHNALLIEEFYSGLNSYRVMVFNKRIIGIVHRFCAAIVGDGKHSIQDLIEAENTQRAKINKIGFAPGPIVVDAECQQCLDELGLRLSDVPANGRRLVLNYACNSARGGTFETLEKSMICRENKKMMIQIATLLNANLVGIDIECEDLRIPIAHSRGVIIEANHNPSTLIHEMPTAGQPHIVSRKMLRTLIFRHPLAYCLGYFYSRCEQ